MAALTLIDIIQDIHAMDEELWHYESRYGLRSRYFYELYQMDKLRDEDPMESRDYTDWAACYDIRRHREELYYQLVRDAMQRVKPQQSVALSDLRWTLQPETVPAGL